MFKSINRLDSVFNSLSPFFEYEINGLDKEPTKYEFNLAGIKKNNIELSIEGNSLYIRAEQEDKKFSKVIHLPSNVNVDSITADYNDGLLVVDMKKEDTKKVIDIK